MRGHQTGLERVAPAKRIPQLVPLIRRSLMSGQTDVSADRRRAMSLPLFHFHDGALCS
jgi:hypothetical protein